MITIKGRGGHGSAPHRALDPIAIAAEVVIALQLMVTRRVDVFDPAVVNVSRITAGTAYNVIPEVAVLEGTTRAVSSEQQAAIRASCSRWWTACARRTARRRTSCSNPATR